MFYWAIPKTNRTGGMDVKFYVFYVAFGKLANNPTASWKKEKYSFGLDLAAYVRL